MNLARIAELIQEGLSRRGHSTAYLRAEIEGFYCSNLCVRGVYFCPCGKTETFWTCSTLPNKIELDDAFIADTFVDSVDFEFQKHLKEDDMT